MSILIKGANVLAADATHGLKPFTGDVLIDGDRIASRRRAPR